MLAPVSENSSAWLMVSNDSANAAPTEAMTIGWLARASRSASQRPRIPTSGTGRSRGRAGDHQQVADPEHEKHADRDPGAEVLEPARRLPVGRGHRPPKPTSVTTAPWPSEKNSPDQRDMPGRTRALERVKPSIATR